MSIDYPTQPAQAYPDHVGRPVICQDRHAGTCRGRVDFRDPLSGTGVPTIRCEGHWAVRLELQARHRRDFPDSSTPPAWYTAQGGDAYAGEHWNEPE